MNELTSLLPREAVGLLRASGRDLVKRIGLDAVRAVVLDVLCGQNLRDATERLTRRRIAALNLALVQFFMEGTRRWDDFVQKLPYMASNNLKKGCPDKAEKWLNLWVLGLTEKAVQNVLRDDRSRLDDYRDTYVKACRDIYEEHERLLGHLDGEIRLGKELRTQVNWMLLLYLLNTVGAETLTIRGSEKSAYGKLFEKFVLGSVLHVLGFSYVPSRKPKRLRGEYWLSTRGERRESDATLLYDFGKAVRFDIGFIGRGNPEISLDKVTRFEREITLGRKQWFVKTIIIVDRIGERSVIEALAARVQGKIIQMCASFWPQTLAKELHDTLGFVHPLVDMSQGKIRKFIERRLATAPLDEFTTVAG